MAALYADRSLFRHSTNADDCPAAAIRPDGLLRCKMINWHLQFGYGTCTGIRQPALGARDATHAISAKPGIASVARELGEGSILW